MFSLRALPAASQVPGFRLLWVSLSSAGLGTAISQVALTWTMLELTGSPFMVGAALAARLAPFLVFGLPLGALSDRVDRRRLIVWADVAGAALAMLVAVLAFAGEMGVAAIHVLSFALGSIDTARMTATQAYVYDLVGPVTATSGIALANLGSQVATSAGAIVGGVVIAQSDMGVAFVLVALAWLFAAGLLGFASPPARTELVKPETSPRRALTLLMRDRGVAAIALLIILTEIFGFSTAALVPTFAKDILRVDAAGLGVLLGARSIGGILGLGWLATRGARRRGGRLFLAATGAFGIVLVAFALSASFPLSLVLMVGTGMTAAALDALGQTLLQRTSPDHERGAAMGVWVFSIGFGPIGLLVLGALAASVGAPGTQVLSGTILLVVAVLLAASTSLRRSA
jgi:MFS family permease